MKQLLYLEAPTPNTDRVLHWLQTWRPRGDRGRPIATRDGIRIEFDAEGTSSHGSSLSIFLWSLQRTTYLKVFRWGERAVPGERAIVNQLRADVMAAFPPSYPAPPEIDLSGQTIFEAIAPHYPKTAEFFQKIPNGEADLQRVYWWEKRWRDGVRSPETPKICITRQSKASGYTEPAPYDLIYLGGALGSIQAAVMAMRGYRVLLIERLTFGRMNREWNISRQEFQCLIDIGLFSVAEFESLIACEYEDGFNKFFDANNPDICRSKVLHTPEVLNIAIKSDKLLQLCGEKLLAAGGEIWERTEFIKADVFDDRAVVDLIDLESGEAKQIDGRMIVDAMGTASPIAWQMSGGRPFNSVCPTVGAVIDGNAAGGIEASVWDARFGDVLNSHGDISRGRQLIWELFPTENGDLTFYLFHYHEIHPENPGSLLEMYEDFFTILPEYRRCDLNQLTWKKATFGYIPGYFSQGSQDRTVAIDRLLAIGDAASLQSPLVFTGFGSLVRNTDRLSRLLDTALTHDLLTAEHLGLVRAYQSNVAVTWLFSKGMMVPTHRTLSPERINAMLNIFFGLLADEPPHVANTFIKDRTTWTLFTRLALTAAWRTPILLWWIFDMAGPIALLRWTGTYLSFTWQSLIGFLLGWLPAIERPLRNALEARYPWLWLRVLSTIYAVTEGIGRPYQARSISQ